MTNQRWAFLKLLFDPHHKIDEKPLSVSKPELYEDGWSVSDAVLWIRIREDLKLFAGSGSEKIISDPDRSGSGQIRIRNEYESKILSQKDENSQQK